jgi:hypothetical protein
MLVEPPLKMLETAVLIPPNALFVLMLDPPPKRFEISVFIPPNILAVRKVDALFIIIPGATLFVATSDDFLPLNVCERDVTAFLKVFAVLLNVEVVLDSIETCALDVSDFEDTLELDAVVLVLAVETDPPLETALFSEFWIDDVVDFLLTVAVEEIAFDAAD